MLFAILRCPVYSRLCMTYFLMCINILTFINIIEGRGGTMQSYWWRGSIWDPLSTIASLLEVRWSSVWVPYRVCWESIWDLSIGDRVLFGGLLMVLLSLMDNMFSLFNIFVHETSNILSQHQIYNWYDHFHQEWFQNHCLIKKYLTRVDELLY